MTTHKDIYLTISENKELFDSKLTEYWDVVKSVWKKNGSKKLFDVDTAGSDYNYGGLDDEQKQIGLDIDARKIIEGSDLEKVAFAWYCAADLSNSTKYFSLEDLAYNNNPLFNINKNTHLPFKENHWSISTNVLSLAKRMFSSASSWDLRKSEDFLEELNKDLGMDFFKNILPRGFSEHVNKKSISSKSKVSRIKNKMDLVIWKKFVNSKTMTQSHFNNCLKTYYDDEFWSPVWNEFFKIDGILDKKYFKSYISKHLSPRQIDKIHPLLASAILEKYHSISDYNMFFRSLSALENIDFSLSNDSFIDFSSTTDFEKYVNSIEWSAFNRGKNENSLFTKKNFLQNLNKIYAA